MARYAKISAARYSVLVKKHCPISAPLYCRNMGQSDKV
jgi:hypothetical protein